MDLTRLRKLNDAQKKINSLGLGLVNVDPWVEVLFGGQKYRFELSYGAVVNIFRETGLTIGVDAIPPSVLLSPEVFPVILLEGLKTHNQRTFGDKEPSDLLYAIPMKHLNYYAAVIASALQAANPDPAELAAITADMEDTQLPLAGMDTFSGSGQSAENSGAPIPIFTE